MPNVQELFRSTTDGIGPEPGFSERLELRRRRHVQRRRIGAYIVGAAVMVAFAFALARGGLDRDRTGTDPTERTVDGVTVTVPPGWRLVSCGAMAPEQHCYGEEYPILVLSNVGGIRSSDVGCPTENPLAQAVVLLVQNLPASYEPTPPPWPIRSPSMGTLEDGCRAGWSYFQVVWAAADRNFNGVVLFAPDASRSDRARMLETFTGMSFGPSSFPERPLALATGVTAGRRWRLVESGSDAPLSLDLYQGGRSWGFGFAAPTQDRPMEWGSHVFGGGDGAVVYGVVADDVTRVHLEGKTEEARILELGPDVSFNAFVLEIEEPSDREIVVILEHGDGETARVPITLGGRSS